MKILLVGCEYSGTTTLAKAIFKWGEEQMGAEFGLFHDHWKIPNTSGHTLEDEASRLTDEEQEQVQALSPKIKEMVQRHSLYYHVAAVGLLAGESPRAGVLTTTTWPSGCTSKT